jgi:hypothetical protein
MWMTEAKAAQPIPLWESVTPDYTKWDNQTLRKFIEKYQTNCKDFVEALNWLGDRSAKLAIEQCTNRNWLHWIRKQVQKVPKEKKAFIIPVDDIITITYGRNEKYAIWHHTGVWDLSEEYVKDIHPHFNYDTLMFT